MTRDPGPVPADEPADERADERADEDPGAGTAVQRRRRRAEVFGDVLPEQTEDERGDSWGEPDPGRRSEEWLRGQVPPHHG